MVESPAGDDEGVIEETFPTARVLCVETQHLAGVVDKMPPDARFWGEKVAQLCIHQPRAEDLSDVGVPRSGSRAAVFLSIVHLLFELGEEAAASRNGLARRFEAGRASRGP